MTDATPLAAARVSLFAHAYSPVSVATLMLPQAIEEIATGKYRSQVCEVRQVLARDGERAYRKAKNNLPAFTFGGIFAPKRGIAHLQQHSGIVLGDMDDVEDIAAAKRAISSDPHTVFVFLSPSATGLKCGVHGPVVGDDAEYKRVWQVISTEYERLYGRRWDVSGKDISRLCYASSDTQAYWNAAAVIFEVPPPPIKEPPTPTSPLHTPTSDTTNGAHRDDYAVHAIKTAVQMIEAAQLGTRHHTRLKAARLLGGYVAGGLLAQDQAYGALAQALAGHTDDLERSLKTIADGLDYGKAHPITIEVLQAERRAWLAAHGYGDRNKPLQGELSLPAGAANGGDPWGGRMTLPLRPYQGYRSCLTRERDAHA